MPLPAGSTLSCLTVEIRDLEYLVASAGSGNLGRAAEDLGLHTSTISRRIARLEEELGLSLFERSHAGVRLTAGGRSVLAHARRALAELDAVRRSAIGNGCGEIGEIRLGVRPSPIDRHFIDLLAIWRGRHPSVQLTVSEINDRELAAALEERRIDIALTLRHAVWPHAATMPLYRNPLLLALPTQHPLAAHRVLSSGAVREEIILVEGWEESQAARELYAGFLGRSARFRSHPASKQSIFALVAAGFGVTLATASEAELPFPGIIFTPFDDREAAVQTVLAWPPEMEDAAVGRFVAFVRDAVRSRGLS